MLLSLLKFEVHYQARQRSFGLFSLLFFAMGYMIGGQGFAQDGLDFNSPYQIAFNSGLFTLGCVFVIMFFSVSGVLRDATYQSEALIYSTSISKRQFFSSRFLGVFLFSVLAFSTFLLGIGLSTVLAPLDPERLAPFHLASYVNVWALLVLPNVFICTSVIFSISMLTKNQTLTYLGAVMIYVLYWVCSIFLNSPLLANAAPVSPENMVYAALADPFGLSAFFQKVQFWTPFQKNSRVLTLSGYFLGNRILWMGISLVLLGLTYARFSFRKGREKLKKTRESRDEQSSGPFLPYQKTRVRINALSQWQSFYSLLKIELSSVFRGLPFIGIMVFWLVIVISETYSKIHQGGGFGESWYPASYILIREFSSALFPFSVLLIVFYSGEVVHRERSFRFSGISDATPAGNLVLFSSKFVALLLLPFFLILSAIICDLGFQVLGGYFDFNPGLYLSVFYYQGVSLLFYVLLALLVQTLTGHKYLGMAITLLLIILLGSVLARSLGIEHPMLRLGRLPEPVYTDMSGYSGETRAYHAYAVYWLSLGLLFVLLSFRLWTRGTVHSLLFRLKRAFTHWPAWQLGAACLLVLVFTSSAAFIFYQTNVTTPYVTSSEQTNQLERYERQYKKYQTLPRLYAYSMKTAIDLYPDENRFVFKADYVLENTSDSLIREVMITERETLRQVSLENAVPVSRDSVLGVRIYRFKAPVKPGQRVNFKYTIDKRFRGFETSRSLVSNGSYLTQNTFEPVLGYRRSLEISDRFEREKRKLPPRPAEEVTDEHLNTETPGAGRVDFETVVSTQGDQTAIAPGELLKTWALGGRKYFHYKTPVRMVPVIGYFSGRYVVKKENYKGIVIEHYYHPGHTFNIDKMTESTRQTLDYCLENFGPYPFRHIRFVEIPAIWGFGGFAHPGTICMVENRLYLIDNRDPNGFDLVAKRTIHEVAHQWWGHILVSRNTEGASLFTEGLAKYTEAVVMEKHYGLGSVARLSRTAHYEYFSGRSNAAGHEPPVYLSYGQQYVDYGKSYTIMMAIRDLIGEKQLNGVLKNLTARHPNEQHPSLTSLEFLNELYKVTPAQHHTLLNDWLKRVITYDLSVKDAKTTRLPDGRYEVTLTLKAQRFENQKDGSEKAIGINELLMVGVFDKHPSEMRKDDRPVYYKAHVINRKETLIRLIVAHKPGFVGVDVFGGRVDGDLGDNAVALK